MAVGYTPHGVDWSPILGSLEQQDTGSFRVGRIVLDHFRRFYTFDQFPGKQSVRSQFVVSVLRNLHTAL